MPSHLSAACELCKGKRYNEATLRVTYKDKTIAEMLETPIDEAAELFKHHKQLARINSTLVARVQTGRTLYLLDEPTTGLHFGDVKKLLEGQQHRAGDRAQP